MKDSAKVFNSQIRMMELNNQKIYFDLETNRLEQKCRVKDAFPQVNNLIKLALRSAIVEETYFNGNKENVHSQLIDAIRKMKMEFSISVEGLGRQEFIKMFLSKKEEDKEEDKEKDMLDKIADAIG